MVTKQPSYYRDLLESIIQEQTDWIKSVTLGYDGDPSINMKINKPIEFGDDSVVLVKMEVPLVGFKGLIGLYFMDQDHNNLERLEHDQEAWVELETIVGSALGLGTVTLGKGKDFYEPLNGGHDAAIRAVLPQGLDHKLFAQYIHAVGMEGAMKILLNSITRGAFALETISVLKSCGLDNAALTANKDAVLKALLTLVRQGEKEKRVMALLDQLKLDWPEIESIKRSLEAGQQ